MQHHQSLGNHLPYWNEASQEFAANLQGDYCYLTLLKKDDAHLIELYKILHEKTPAAHWTYLPYGPFANYEDFVCHITKDINLPGNCMYVIKNKENTEILGYIGYMNIVPIHGTIEIGHVNFSDKLKKTRTATETVYLLLNQAFKLGYRRVEWKCNNLNSGSKAAAQRFGFTYEGLFRQHYVFKQHSRDTAWFSMLDHEWPAIQNKFMQWLNPNNFDFEGNQKKRIQEF